MKYDSKLPEITGSVGFVIANTYVALSQYQPGKYPMDFIRMNLLLYATNRNMWKKFGGLCFEEPFIGLMIDDMLIPVLPSVAALYGFEPPCLVENARGKAIIVQVDENTQIGSIIVELYQNTCNMNNKELFAYLKDTTLSYLQSGRIISFR